VVVIFDSHFLEVSYLSECLEFFDVLFTIIMVEFGI